MVNPAARYLFIKRRCRAVDVVLSGIGLPGVWYPVRFEPAPFFEPENHEYRNNEHGEYGAVKTPVIVGKGYYVKVHSEYATNDGGGRHYGS